MVRVTIEVGVSLSRVDRGLGYVELSLNITGLSSALKLSLSLLLINLMSSQAHNLSKISINH